MPKPSKSSRCQLLVEGDDDLFSIVHFTERHGIVWQTPPGQPIPDSTPFVVDCDGYDNLLPQVSVFANGPYERIGIVVDADERLESRWRDVRRELASVQIELPEQPSAGGVIVPGISSGRRVGVWLMPDNQLPGNLETLLKTLVPPSDPLWPHAQSCTQAAAKLGAPFRVIHQDKAELHAWLAWQEDPGLPFGAAIQRKVFSSESASAMAFLGWFNRLFIES
jgi:hypothetical protein